jgi:hypothetical protein
MYLCADSRLGIDFPAPCGYLSLHFHNQTEAADMNGIFQMQGGKNWILPK